MLSTYLIDEIELCDYISNIETSIAIIEYYQKQQNFDCSIYMEEEANNGEQKEGFFQKIGNAIKKAFEAIANFFKKLFHKNEENDKTITNVANELQEAVQQGETPESIIEKMQSNLSPEQRDDLFDFLTTWMRDPTKTPSILSKNAAVEIRKLTELFNQFDQLLKGDIGKLQANYYNMMKSIEQCSKELKFQMGITDVSIQNNGGDAKQYFAENGISSKESSKVLETFSNVLDNLQKNIAQAMSNPEKAKILESYSNVSIILKESMNAGKLISMRLIKLGAMTPELEQALSKDKGLKLNAKLAGKGNFEIYDKNGSSKVAQRGRALGNAVSSAVANDFSNAGLDTSQYQKYTDVANKMAVNKHQQDVMNLMRNKRTNGS